MKAEPSQLGLAKEMKASAIVALLAFSACTTVRVESLATLQGQTEAVTFSSHDRERKEGRKVSVTGLPEILARAAWVEGRPFHKGGDWVRFADGREIFLPVGFEFFFVGDTPGHFEIRKEDHQRYREIVRRIQNEANQPRHSHP